MEQMEMILTYVTAFLGSGVGATILACLIKGIANVVAKVKIANASKLSEKDKADMVNAFKGSLKDGIAIDMDAQLDRATNKRFGSIEKLLNEVAQKEVSNEQAIKLIAEAMSEFKTISSDIKNRLADVSKLDSSAIGKIEVVESGEIKVKEEPKKEEVNY